MTPEEFAVSFSILFKEEGGLFVAYCLELDLGATGEGASQAKAEMIDLIRAQLDYAFNNDNLDHLYHPAAREVWREFYACLNNEQERVRVAD